MPILTAIRSKRTWLGLAVAAGVILIMCGLGAWLIVNGILPRTSETGWLCVSYVLAGAIGTWIAAREGKGTILRALLLCILITVFAWTVSLVISNDMRLAEGGWRIPVYTAAGCLLAGFFCSRSGQGSRGKKRRSIGYHRRTTARR